MDIQVCDATLDDFGEDFASSLVCGYADFGFMARVEVLAYDRRKVGGLDFVEGITFFFVRV